MRIVHLSDHAREELASAQQQQDAVAAGQAAWRQAQSQAHDDVRAARRAKPLWKRVLGVPSDDQRAAQARVAHADQAIRQTAYELQSRYHGVQQQAAGVQGEDALTWGLSRLPDDWIMLRG